MIEPVVVQGRELREEDIQQIRELIAAHSDWGRTRLSILLAEQWNWRNGAGRLKDMAVRTLLIKLEEQGFIQLPARRFIPYNRMTCKQAEVCQLDLIQPPPINRPLRQVGLLTVNEVSGDAAGRQRVNRALGSFHYLGHRGTVGENLQYTVTNHAGDLLACLLFGSPAWKCRARDQFIGWNAVQRAAHLYLITNNTRFLILPSVRVPHLATWAFGQVLRRLSADWQRKYGHPIMMVETFVDRTRFAGTCYKAGNWICPGSTTGRTRQDRDHSLSTSVKDVYLYPLHRKFREVLTS
jgi:hypothetical protein